MINTETYNIEALINYNKTQAYSCYGIPYRHSLFVESHNTTSIKEAKNLHVQLSSLIHHNQYPCLGAKSVFSNNTYRLGYYPSLGSREATLGLQHDLQSFLQEISSMSYQFVSFIAAFSAPEPFEEITFEQLLWKQLSGLHQVDDQPWDHSVSADPQKTDFSFSFDGQAFFVIGIHPNSSRLARQFVQPLLIFNLHQQFEQLRETGKYEKMKSVIQARDVALQGSVNPMMTDFRRSSEARQYSGRAVGASWQCPFHSSKIIATDE